MQSYLTNPLIPSEGGIELAQKLGELQPSTPVFPPERTGQLADLLGRPNTSLAPATHHSGFFRSAARDNAAVMHELQALHGGAPGLVGFYDPAEINDIEWDWDYGWHARWVDQYLGQYVNATANMVAGAGKVYSCAPYFGGNFRAGGPDPGRDPSVWGPANVSHFWRRVFAAVPAMQRVWVQDSIGVSTDTLPKYTRFMSPSDVAPFYQGLQASHGP